MTKLDEEIKKRRTFAIISHPDAGKTTITEKLLLFGGAIVQAGAIKAKKAAKYTTSDWMELEKQRGVSVSTSVMCFEYNGSIINLLDTPGHADFSEDTYRTLTAVDSVLMVIDSTKGVEERTKKLMDVCRLRNIPVITFMNKLDREGMNPFDLLEDIEKQLNIQPVPLSWPVSMGKTFKGVYNITDQTLLSFKPGQSRYDKDAVTKVTEQKLLNELIGDDLAVKLNEDLEMIKHLLPGFDVQLFLEGMITPVFFGSAINNFGVLELLQNIIKLSPYPRDMNTEQRTVHPDDEKMTGLVFKIHANMDPKHRDRIAFMRICSGTFNRGMKVFHVRLGRDMKISNPMTFMAQNRSITEEAYPGDIVGLHDTGLIKIGDTFTEGEILNFTGIPSFSPEVFRRVINKNPMKSKQLNTGLMQLSEEGVVQLFKTVLDGQLLLGAVGELQFDVVRFRLENEYTAICDYSPVEISFAYWIKSSDKQQFEKFQSENKSKLASDKDDNLVFLFKGKWEFDHIKKLYQYIEFYRTSECNVRDKVI
ncbi:MAG: peptide chain release factor 3 [Candidatus Margulisbacteria bacterium]|nr:peptide chain release factor 3 [Candidatus Margulisiibacteriota bacterium]